MKNRGPKTKALGVQAQGFEVKDQINYQVDSTPGRFPVRKNTVLAAVLASLLEGRYLTGMEAVFGESTTRLAHHIWALGVDHDWHSIRVRGRIVGTNDGRVEEIAEYYLPADVIEAAMSQGARAWIGEVRKARAARRAKAAQATQEAERLNAARRRNPALGQLRLFGGAA